MDQGLTVTFALPDFVGSAALLAVIVTVFSVVGFGATYFPSGEIVPPPASEGSIDQVTAEFNDPDTSALNCCSCSEFKVAEDGFTLTVMGLTVTLALPDFVGFAALLAVIVTVFSLVGFGATYFPSGEIVPPPASEGSIDQVTAEFDDPDTSALNCCSCSEFKVAEDGFTLMVIGSTVTLALPLFVGSAALRAVIVTVFAGRNVWRNIVSTLRNCAGTGIRRINKPSNLSV